MRANLVMIIALLFSPLGFAAKPEAASDAALIKKCKAAVQEVGQPGGSALSKEMIELELSGYRWAGGPDDIACLKNKKTFNYIQPIHIRYGDVAMLDPKYILKKDREIKITKEKWIDDGSVSVDFVYIGTEDGKDVAVNDHLVYTINFGEKRKVRGCASFMTEPQHFVMRETCHQD